MIPFKQYLNDLPAIDEALHPDIQAAIDQGGPAQNRLYNITKTIHRVLDSGRKSGLEKEEPLKGSSRAVFLPRDPHPVHIDGRATRMQSAVKIAYPGMFDKYNKSGKLLGEHQNLVEANPATIRKYSVLRPTQSDSKGNNTHFETNTDHGVLPPMLGSHPGGHHLHVARVNKIDDNEFKRLTRTESYPKGISHQEFHDAIQDHYYAAHGKKHIGATSRQRIEDVQSHPFVKKFQRFVADTGSHPADYRLANMGTWTHPATGNKHIVASDYGFSTQVAKHYADAKRNMMQAETDKNRWRP
jgi:hypothetical protein